MDPGSIFLILALLLVVGAYLARPFREGGSTDVSDRERQLSTLLAERDRLLDALQELDFDHQMGKIPAGEYPAQRTNLVQRGASILKELDSFQGKVASLPEEPLFNNNNGRRHLKAPDDDLETIIAQRRRIRREKSAGFCPQCGHAVQTSDKFCSKCGSTIH